MDMEQPSLHHDAMPKRSRWPRRIARRDLGRVVLVVIAGLLAMISGNWLHYRFTHVLVEDARIAADMVVLSSRVPGWIDAVGVTEGATVRRGELLLRVDNRSATLQLHEVEAQLTAAAARRDEIMARISMIDRQTASQSEARRARIAAAEAALAGAEAQLNLAQTEYARARLLKDAGAGTPARLDQTMAVLESARQLALGRRSEVADAQASLAESVAARKQIVVLQRQIDIVIEEERGLRMQRDRAGLDLADRTLTMPFDGVVDRVFVDPGEYVTPGQRVLMIHDPNRIRVDANVKETDIRFFRRGTRVTVTVDAYPGLILDGTVEHVGQAATSEFALLPNPNPSGSFTKIAQRLPVRIMVEQHEGRLRPGMMVEVEAKADE